MIPLDRWFIDREAREQGRPPEVEWNDDPVEPLLEPPPATDLPSLSETGRLKELEEELAAVRAEMENEREAFVSREQELWDRLGQQAGQHLAHALGEGLCQLQASIESAVVDVLTPFLERATVDGAAAAVSGVIRDIVSEPQDSLLSVSAPRELHEAIGHTLAELGMAATLAEADDVTLVFAERSLRIETTVRQWAEAIVWSRA